jgi:NAD(P)H-dependent FMN reductase
MVRLLAISGSLREASFNARLLAAAQWVRLDGLTIKTYCGLHQLPRFNPDLLQSPPEPVLALYALIADTDGLLISCPEYARGMPGSFKNMLDWLVSSETFQECRLRCSMPRLGLPAPKLCCG